MDLSAAVWKKATRSNESGDACIEMSSVANVIAIRDSKDPDGPKLIISHGDFRHFASAIKEL